MRSDSLDFIFNSYFQNLRFPTFLELNADYNSNGHFTFNALRPVRFSRLLLLICIFTENNVRRENQGDQDRIAWNKIEFRVRFVQFCSISGPWSITNSGIAFAQYSKSFNLDFNHRDQNLREKQLYIFFIIPSRKESRSQLFSPRRQKAWNFLHFGENQSVNTIGEWN